MEQKTLKNHVVLVTGALGGIGQKISEKLGGAGAQVVLIDSQRPKASELKALLPGRFAVFFRADVKKSAQVKALVKKIYQKFGRLDALVNCAGVIGPIGKLHILELAKWQNAFAVNLIGTVNFCHAVLPYMLKQRRGKIVNLAGGGAVEPFPNFSAYASSKAAVVRFSENLAKEYEAYNIQINTLSPGRIKTKLLDELLSAGQERVGKDYYKEVVEDKKRGADSVQVAADLALFLCQPKNKLTGKLVSAKWDDWRKFSTKKILELNKNSKFTLRRIDNKYFYEK